MKVFVVLAALMCVASAGLAPIVIIPSSQALLRTPGDSAIVRSERLGGNFAYTVAEGQAFRTIQPILTSQLRTVSPIGVSYINPLPVISTIDGRTILINDQPTEQRLRDEAQKQLDREIEAQEQLIQAAQQSQREQEELIRQQVEKQLEQQQLLIQQQKDQEQQIQDAWKEQQQKQIDQLNQLNEQSLTVAPISPIATPVVAPVEPAGPGAIAVSETDDSIVVENVALKNESPKETESENLERSA